jgi:hypothetical protein
MKTTAFKSTLSQSMCYYILYKTKHNDKKAKLDRLVHDITDIILQWK